MPLKIYVPLHIGSARDTTKRNTTTTGGWLYPKTSQRKRVWSQSPLCSGTRDTLLPWGTKPSCPGPTRRGCHLAAARKNWFLSRDLSRCLRPWSLHTILAFATVHQSRCSHPSCCSSFCRLSLRVATKRAKRSR